MAIVLSLTLMIGLQMKKINIVISDYWITLFIYASYITVISAQQHRVCGVDSYYKAHALYAQLAPAPTKLEPRSLYTIPVIVHIVWQKSVENISDLQVQRQLERLNLDFNNPNLDRKSVPSEFRKNVGNPQIRFCLASRDPNGDKHTGIIRSQTLLQNIGSSKEATGRYSIHYTSLGGQDAWDPNRYLNIWVGQMDNIFGRSTIGGKVPILAEDGVVIDTDYFTADPAINSSGRTLVHEMGHYLGLLHLWGAQIGDCIEDDGIQDTPLQDGPYYDCPNYPQQSCNASSMFMNYMDYVDDACLHLFTRDQIKVMAMTLNAARPGLISGQSICSFKNESVDLDNLFVFVDYPTKRIKIKSSILTQLPIQVSLVNLMGQKMIDHAMTLDAPKELYTKDAPPGIYLLFFRYNKQIRTFKLLIL